MRSFILLIFISCMVFLTACMEAEGVGSQEREQACTVQDEAAFLKASAEIRALAARTKFSKTAVQISRCGYMIATTSSGLRKKANLDSLYGKIGSPTWELTVAARSLTYLSSGRTYQNDAMFTFSSRNGKSVSRSELEALNRTLRTLAGSSVGRNNASVNIDQELAAAASLDRATDKIREAIGTTATVLANSTANFAPDPAPAPVSNAQTVSPAAGQNIRGFSCTVYCNPGDKELSFPVQASSKFKAEEFLKSLGLNKICTRAGYSGVGGGFASDGVNCR